MAKRQGVPGAGASAGCGLGGMRQQNFEAAVNSVPKLDFPHEGFVVLENVTPQQMTGLRELASRADMKTGQSPVWKLLVSGKTVTVYHNRYRARYEAAQETKRCVELVGRITFDKHNRAQYKPATDDHKAGILAIIKEQNRLAAKFPGRARWEHTENNGTFYIVRVYQPKAVKAAA